MNIWFKTTLIAALALAGCDHTPERNPAESRPEVRAEDVVDASFALTGKSDVIGLRADALDKEFLLDVSLIYQAYMPTWTGLKSRVVAFQRRGEHVFMLEATDGHSVTNELPQTIVLAKFPIVSETAGTLSIDFAAGMSGLFVESGWYASDFQGSNYTQDQWKSISVENSMIESATFTSRGELLIDQAAMLAMGQGAPKNLQPVRVKYYLKPYRPSVAFETRENKSFDRYGFFEATPRLGLNGDQKVFATRFDHTKKITFAISANTPPEFRDAIKDGILYWNKAFGSEVIDVVDAPEGVTAPNRDFNVVQWITYDAAGFAYADAQMDPRTGEINHAQVYLTSTFGVYGKADVRRFLRQQGETGERGVGENAKTDGMDRGVGLKGFEAGLHCRREVGARFSHQISALLETDVEDSQILAVAQDYVREVTAHEIGHTLGLRHNFAGSLAGDYDLSQSDENFARYIETGDAPDFTVSSSVMDYHPPYESSWLGDQIEKGRAALAYDQIAIKSLYYGEELDFDNNATPLFCTDSHRTIFSDCGVWDATKSPLAYAAWTAAKTRAQIANELAEWFISYVSPVTGEKPWSVGSIPAPAGLVAYLWNTSSPSFIAATSTDYQLLSVWRSFDIVDSLNRSEVMAARDDHVEADLNSLGGLPALLPVMTAQDRSRILEEFRTVINSDSYFSGIGPGGETYLFSEADREILIGRVEKMMVRVAEAAAKDDIFVLGLAESVVDQARGTTLAEIYESRVRDYVFNDVGSDSYEVTLPDSEDPTIIELPRFSYPLQVRQAAAGLFATKRGATLEWGLMSKGQVRTALSDLLKSALTIDPATADVETLPSPVARWVLENRAVSAGLDFAYDFD